MSAYESIKQGLTEALDFARSIGMAKGTLLNWEQGLRRPAGPAEVLLAMIGRRPSLVRDLFAMIEGRLK